MKKHRDLPYDETNPSSIENYSKELIGKSFHEVITDFYDGNPMLIKEKVEYYNNPRGKGSLGNLIEELFFMYKPNSDSSADFSEAKVELKVTPYEMTKSKQFKAGERMVISMIPYDKPLDLDFNSSHVREKIELILIILYLRDRTANRVDQKINFSKLFSLFSNICKEDLEIIKSDYEKIVTKIQLGQAHELSEGDTLYLGACTKGPTAEKSYANQYYNSIDKAKRRAFCLKQPYMTYVINNYIMGDTVTYEPIVKNIELLKNYSFEEIVLNTMDSYIGMSKEDLVERFQIHYDEKDEPKNIFSIIAFRMLGLKSNKADELQKADITVKAIRVEESGKIIESMSLPSFKAIEFVEETFEDSKVYEYFSQKKFLFVVFQKVNGVYLFKGAKFWNMKTKDLEGIGKYEWELIQNVYKRGVKFNFKKTEQRITVCNDIPKSSETSIFHIRPHVSKSAYLLHEIGYRRGDIKKDGDMLPNGDFMTKQSFWLNNDYVQEQIVSLIE